MMTLRIASVSILVLMAAGTTACGAANQPPNVPAAPAAKATTAPTSAPTTAPSAELFAPFKQAFTTAITTAVLAPPPRVEPPLVIEVDQVAGDDVERTRAIFASTREPIQKQCSPDSTGALRVKVKSEPRGVKMSVEPGSSLTGPLRRCILEALSTVALDDLPTYPNNAARPTGFSSMLTVSW